MQPVTASVSTDRFSLPLPGGWEDRSAVTLTGPVQDGVQANVVVTREVLCDGLGLGAFSDGWVRRLGDQVPVSESAPIEHIVLDGRRGHVRTVSWQATGLAITQLVALVVDGRDAFAVVCTAASGAFADVEPTFRAAVEGFRFSGPPASDDDAE